MVMIQQSDRTCSLLAGLLTMSYGLFKDSPGYDSLLALVAILPACQTLAASGPAFGPAMPRLESCWMVLYRLAYEQARAALEPSRFQRLLEPSRN
jgi:hypothetical protein